MDRKNIEKKIKKGSSVRFQEDGHCYFIGEEMIKHTLTEILRKLGISPDYSAVPAAVLQQAANRGTYIHDTLEIYDNFGELPPFVEEDYKPLIDDYIAKKQEVLCSELAVAYKTVLATKIDKVIIEGDDVIVADVKTTAQPHIESVRWQCSFGAYMLYHTCKIQATKGRLIWLNRKTNKCELRDFDLYPVEQIEPLLQAVENENWINYQLILNPDATQLVPANVIQEITSLIHREQEIKDKLSKFKDDLKKLMRERGLKKVELEGLTITYSLPTIKKTFDLKSLQTAHPEINYDDYYKQSESSDSIRLTV